MAKLFCSARDPTPNLNEGCVLTLMSSDNANFTVGYVNQPYVLLPQELTKATQSPRRHIEQNACWYTFYWTKFLQATSGHFTGYFLDERGDRCYRDSNCTKSFRRVFKWRYPIFGAGSANGAYPTAGFQFCDDIVLKSSLVLAMMEVDLQMGSGMGHGFRPLAPKRLVATKVTPSASGKSGWVESFDDHPAKALLNDNNLHSRTIRRPVLGAFYGDDYEIVAPAMSEANYDGSVLFSRQVREHDAFALLDATQQEMTEAAEHAITVAVDQIPDGATPGQIGLIVAFECASRYGDSRTSESSWLHVGDSIRRQLPTTPALAALAPGNAEWMIGNDQGTET